MKETGWDGRIRTDECQSQSLVPYRLATSQYLVYHIHVGHTEHYIMHISFLQSFF